MGRETAQQCATTPSLGTQNRVARACTETARTIGYIPVVPARRTRGPLLRQGLLAPAAILVLGCLLIAFGCEGTKHLIFDPIEPKPHVGPIPVPDAGKTIPEAGQKAPPVVDASSMEDEDAGTDPEPPQPDVDFVWTESLPGQGTCRAGRYAGSFDCT